MRKKAFTLIELLAVLVIIGILSSIALPRYNIMKERALAKEAITNLKLMAAAERIYKMESSGDVYVRCSCYITGTGATGCDNTTYGCNYLLRLSLNPQNWEYTIGTTVDYKIFKADANRKGNGGYLECIYSLWSTDTGGEPEGSNCP